MKKLSVLIGLLLLSVIAMVAQAAPADNNPIAVIETSMGTITCELFEDKAPKTVENFITLANKGFYNGLIFHRVVKGFVIQGGDPNGNGTGGSGTTIPLEVNKDLNFNEPYMLAMAPTARSYDPNDYASSQFFITVDKTPSLNNHFAIFGKVIKGIDVVNNINTVNTIDDKPTKNVVIQKITITPGTDNKSNAN